MVSFVRPSLLCLIYFLPLIPYNARLFYIFLFFYFYFFFFFFIIIIILIDRNPLRWGAVVCLGYLVPSDCQNETYIDDRYICGRNKVLHTEKEIAASNLTFFFFFFF